MTDDYLSGQVNSSQIRREFGSIRRIGSVGRRNQVLVDYVSHSINSEEMLLNDD